MNKQTIGLVLRPGIGEIHELVSNIHQRWPSLRFCIENQGHHAIKAPPDWITPVDAAAFADESELVLVLGGDGTFIHAASLLKDCVVPILGVNMGHIGFLTEVGRDELIQVLPLALEGGLPHTDRMRLDAELQCANQPSLLCRILNDAVVSLEKFARIATFRVALRDDLITNVRGDGVIVSTPTGSTAYALAAGGSVVSPHLEAIVITPVCPHQLTQRPLIVRPHAEVIITLESDSRVFATFDGQSGREFRQGDTLIVRKAPVPTRVLNVPWRNYFQTLRTKLRWGDE